MVLRKYADVIIERIKPLTAVEIKILVWMSLRAQYGDGCIKVNRNRIKKEMDLNRFSIDLRLPGLVRAGLIEQLPGYGNYRVKLMFPLGKYSIQVPKQKVFTEE